ncbi:MAG: B12-binding domain-containing radical SAM protein, partial [Theionarchaea archaeon]|nr:B12-binding domain-containing radical SAM protein [Theionarchaea archaeon]
MEDEILNGIEETKKRIQTTKEVPNDFLFINIALQVVSLAYYPTLLLLNTYTPPAFPLKQTIIDRRINPFIELFEELCFPDLLKGDTSLIGISVSSRSQVIPALTLSRMMKKEKPELHVCLGGNTFSRSSEALHRLKDVFDFADSIIAFDGETALASLIECVEKEKDFSTVPNLIFREGERIKHSKTYHREDLNALPTPNFDGLPLKLYFSHILVLPVQTARGCYWARCAFCAVPYGEGGEYRSRDAALVAEDMDNLQSRYNTSYFELADDAVPPQKLRQLSEELLSKDMDAKWTAEVRLEKQFTPPLLSRMYEAGCRILYFGLESANPRILKLMDKGTDIETAHR